MNNGTEMNKVTIYLLKICFCILYLDNYDNVVNNYILINSTFQLKFYRYEFIDWKNSCMHFGSYAWH